MMASSNCIHKSELGFTNRFSQEHEAYLRLANHRDHEFAVLGSVKLEEEHGLPLPHYQLLILQWYHRVISYNYAPEVAWSVHAEPSVKIKVSCMPVVSSIRYEALEKIQDIPSDAFSIFIDSDSCRCVHRDDIDYAVSDFRFLHRLLDKLIYVQDVLEIACFDPYAFSVGLQLPFLLLSTSVAEKFQGILAKDVFHNILLAEQLPDSFDHLMDLNSRVVGTEDYLSV
jgi:hypothetical protein